MLSCDSTTYSYIGLNRGVRRHNRSTDVILDQGRRALLFGGKKRPLRITALSRAQSAIIAMQFLSYVCTQTLRPIVIQCQKTYVGPKHSRSQICGRRKSRVLVLKSDLDARKLRTRPYDRHNCQSRADAIRLTIPWQAHVPCTCVSFVCLLPTHSKDNNGLLHILTHVSITS